MSGPWCTATDEFREPVSPSPHTQSSESDPRGEATQGFQAVLGELLRPHSDNSLDPCSAEKRSSTNKPLKCLSGNFYVLCVIPRKCKTSRLRVFSECQASKPLNSFRMNK